jgi:hypothetical protein
MTRRHVASSSLLRVVIVALSLCNTGCLSAFIDAGFRELDDDGDDATYAHQSYGAHVLDSTVDSMIDAAFEDDDECD